MSTTTSGGNDRANTWTLCVVALMLTAASWYPYSLDLPKRVKNSAQRLDDGAWSLDRNSRVVASLPARAAELMATGHFQMTLEARAGVRDQAGPARLVSIARNPHDVGLMVGIDGRDIVIYLPCSGRPNGDAAWRLAGAAGSNLSLTLAIGETAVGGIALLANGARHDMPNRCPAGSVPTVSVTAPLAIGNVASGHRPFAGRIEKLEVTDGAQRIDLLRDTTWEVPGAFWVWPERFYEPANPSDDELFVALWHVVGFAVLGYLVAAVARRRSTIDLFFALLLAATLLNTGKLLIAGRHVFVADFVFNLAGAAAGLFLRRRHAPPNAFNSAGRSP